VFRLEAGATVTLQAYQNSGGNLNLLTAAIDARMVRSIPSLT
jgi:hypothetical protein